MSPKRTTMLVSRLICLYFSYRAVLSLMAIPTGLSGALMLSNMRSVYGNHRFPSPMQRFLMGSGASLLLGIVLDIALAVIFYRCGPEVSRFLLGDDISPETVMPEGVEGTA
jgi:hypothetical protein